MSKPHLRMHWTGLPVPGRRWHLCRCGSSGIPCGVPWGRAHCRWIHCPGSHWTAAASVREGASRRSCLPRACLVPVFSRLPLPLLLRLQTATNTQSLILEGLMLVRHHACFSESCEAVQKPLLVCAGGFAAGISSHHSWWWKKYLMFPLPLSCFLGCCLGLSGSLCLLCFQSLDLLLCLQASNPFGQVASDEAKNNKVPETN